MNRHRDSVHGDEDDTEPTALCISLLDPRGNQVEELTLPYEAAIAKINEFVRAMALGRLKCSINVEPID